MARLKRMWFNQPSTSQQYHKYHGRNVLADFDYPGGPVVYFLVGDTESMLVHANALSEGWHTLNEQSPIPLFDNYEISGCLHLDGGGVEACDDADAEFWTLYGHTPGVGATAIGDFDTPEAAAEIYHKITGKPFGDLKANMEHIARTRGAN